VSEARRNILFILNPNAGVGKGRVDSLIASVVGNRAAYTIEFTERAGHATELAGAAIGTHDLVVGVGGDGTLNEVGRALVGTGVAMGIVPAGSGNALARALSIPLDLRDSVEQLLTGSRRCIDVGRLGEDVFLSTAGIGIDAEACWRFSHSSSGRRGLFPYVHHTLSVLGHAPEPIRLYLDGRPDCLEVCSTMLTFANTNQFGYAVEVAPGAIPDDGKLDVSVLEDMTLLRAAMHGYRLFTGTFDRTPGVSRHQVERIRVEREAPGYFQVDGEAREGGASLEVSISPSCLDVVVPQRP
jgi:diacylglycerol kinase (ATP)